MEYNPLYSHTGTEKQTLPLIQLRTEYEAHFTEHRNSFIQGFDWVLNRDGGVKMYSDTVTNLPIKM